jgi:hypothetical protein
MKELWLRFASFFTAYMLAALATDWVIRHVR